MAVVRVPISPSVAPVEAGPAGQLPVADVPGHVGQVDDGTGDAPGDAAAGEPEDARPPPARPVRGASSAPKGWRGMQTWSTPRPGTGTDVVGPLAGAVALEDGPARVHGA